MNIPEAFARGIVEREGEHGQTWLASLSGLVDEFLQRWCCTPIAAVRHGQVGIILPVRRNDGSPAVLKISFTHPGNFYEAHAFAVWGGRGAVKLYERDDARFAMLLEQADWQTLDDVGDVDQATETLGQLARRLAVPAPSDLPRLSDRADEWELTLSESARISSSPLSQRALGAALATIQDLGRDQPDTMVHGDLHFGNVVRAQREPWLVVDPKGLAGDLASDALRVVVGGRESLFAADDLQAEIRRRLSIFADGAEIDREQAVRWLQLNAAMGAARGPESGETVWVTQLLAHVAEMLA